MLINILSGIWFYPITVLFNKSREEQLSDIKKLQDEYGFTQVINLDDDLRFWWLKQEKYLPEIQEQLDINNFKKIEKKFKSYIKLIEKTTLNNPDKSILFVAINSIECMYVLHLYIYLKHCGIAKEDRNMTIAIITMIKNKYNFEIKLDDKLKQLLF